MTDYAVGDIQGCHGPLRRLLAKVDFSPSRDRLWVTGDLVNRGPESLATLRYIESLGDAAVVVLGNHDLHLLAVALGGHSLRAKDTLQEVLEAPDRDRLLHWLRRQHLCVYDPDRMLVMAHAGVPHIWSLAQALACAREVEAVIRGDRAAEYFQHMYGNEPACWHEDLTGRARWRVITNYFTRMRFCAADGTLDLDNKGPPEDDREDAPFRPWFRHPHRLASGERVIFGHWAALGGATDDPRFIGLDTGCVWGGELTFFNLANGERLAEPCGG